MSVEQPTGGSDARGFGSFILLIVLAFAVLLVVYVYVGRLSGSTPGAQPGDNPGPSAMSDAAAPNVGDGGVGAAGASPDDGSGGSPASRGEPGEPEQSAVPVDAQAGPLPTQPDTQARIGEFRDPLSDFRLDVLDTWRRTTVDASDGGRESADLGAPNYDVVFVRVAAGAGDGGDGGPGEGDGGDGDGRSDGLLGDGDGGGGGGDGVLGDGLGARLAVAVRSDAESQSLDRWVSALAPGLSPVDGRSGANATIAGQPAVIVWRDETPTTPAHYAAVLTHGDRAYAITYGAAEGGAMIQEYLRALVTFELGDGASEDTIPPIPRPSKRYFPASALLGAGES